MPGMPEGDKLRALLPLTLSLPPDSPPLRLDAALSLAFPGTGLRARRRLWDWCRITVNGQPRRPGFVVQGGDTLHLSSRSAEAVSRQDAEGVRLVALSADYAALFKPDGLHSAVVGGSPHASLEETLSARWTGLLEDWFSQRGTRKNAGEPPVLHSVPPELLTRLDRGTSGLVLAALTPGAADRFRQMERRGLVRKTYLALLRGALSGPLRLRNRLDTADRVRTRVLPEADPDPVRHTFAEPLCRISAPEKNRTPEDIRFQGLCTLARIVILRGARHQIRAHLAAAGYPLLGETLYAPSVAGETSIPLYLHHARLSLPGFTAQCSPPWPLPLHLEQALGDVFSDFPEQP